MWTCVTVGQAIRIERYIPKSTNTHSEHEIFIALTGTMVARRRLNVTWYVRALPVLFKYREYLLPLR